MKSATQHKELLAAAHPYRSAKAFRTSPVYKEHQKTIQESLLEPEYLEPMGRPETFERNTVKVAAWNIERGMHLEGIKKTLKSHPILSQADVFLLTETDVGMARSGNHHVPKELVEELTLYGVFGPAYMNLDKGNGFEAKLAKGENTLALQGHSILSRYPIDNAEMVALPDTKDHLSGRERQIGSEQAVVATIKTPHGPLHVACVHLSLRSSRAQRRGQMNAVLKVLHKRKGPAIIGGDWNTTTYNSHKAWPTIVGFWVRVAMGVTHVVRNHYPHPNRFFEKKLFNLLKKEKFETAEFNLLGGCTVHYDIKEPQNFENLSDWIPKWCFAFVGWALRELNGVCSFKLDWFAARGLLGKDPTIVSDLPRGNGRFSDHDPILVDVRPL